MTRQAHHADIVGEIFAAKLRAETQLLRLFQQFFFQFDITERLAVLVTFGRQAVIVFGGCELDGFQGRLRRGAANDKSDVVRRASRSPEATHFFHQPGFEFARAQQRFGFLIQIGFVRRAAAFGDAQEFVFVAVDAVEINLRRQVGTGVHFFIHIQRGVL